MKQLTENQIYQLDAADVERVVRERNEKGLISAYDWYRISRHESLSEDFIREFADKLDWYWISTKQTLSEAFVIEMQLKGHI